MCSQTVVLSVALLALSCLLLLPRGGESAGGIVSLHQPEDDSETGIQLQEESLDDPQNEQGQLLESETIKTLQTGE